MKIAVAGLGLIGGSFYKASLRAGHETVGLHHGDAHGMEDADIILVCLPPAAIVPWVRAHAPQFKDGALVVDICGVKRNVVHALHAADVGDENVTCDQLPVTSSSAAPQNTGHGSRVTGHGMASDEATPSRGRARWRFVGGHPMAGREVSGYENSSADLFVGASMILTPEPDTPESDLKKLEAFFASVGFHETVRTTPERHDERIAFTSQLCHVVATTFARDPLTAESAGFTAGSFADMTRVATQDADVWSALYAENRDMLLAVIDRFRDRLDEFRDALAAGDDEAVRRMIEEGSEKKKALLRMR